MTTTANSTIVCASPDGQQRVMLDLAAKWATFEGCHQSRSFFSVGNQSLHVCPFTDLRAAHDFMSGEHRGSGMGTVLKLGQATGVHPVDEPLGSVFISTATGRCRVFAHWHNFAEFRAALREIVKDSPGGHWSDDPRLMPVYAVVMVAVVGGIIWMLL